MGILREYPNVMSYEGVLGLENNKVGRRDSPVDRTVFAFTRLLAGPMDYTPGAFDNVTESEFVARNSAPMAMGTRAQQLALYVVFETPVPMVSDSPQNYEGQPAFQFIKDVPVSWDETRVLNGRPGEFVTIARRHGDEWDLGSITNWDERTLRVPLAFLGCGPVHGSDVRGCAGCRNPAQTRDRAQPASDSALGSDAAPGARRRCGPPLCAEVVTFPIIYLKNVSMESGVV